jgi:hypothetical protein
LQDDVQVENSILLDVESGAEDQETDSITDTQDIADTSTTTTHPVRRRHRRSAQPRLTQQQKLLILVEKMEEIRWSFEEFLSCWLGASTSSTNITLPRRRYRTRQDRRNVLYNQMQTLDIGLTQQSIVNATIDDELSALTTVQYFNRFDTTSNIDDIDFKVALQSVQDVAPTWYGILQHAGRNRRAHQASYPVRSDEIDQRRIFCITSMVCNLRARQQSNFLVSAMSIYLLGSGTKRRVIETIAGLGFCCSYPQTNILMKQIASEAQVSS